MNECVCMAVGTVDVQTHDMSRFCYIVLCMPTSLHVLGTFVHVYSNKVHVLLYMYMYVF